MRRLTHSFLDALHDRLLSWYADKGRDLPWRRTTDPYAVLVSEVMLQQTQVPRVVPHYTAFLGRFPTLEALAEATPSDVLRLWSGLGYNNRAVRLQRCAALLVDRERGTAGSPAMTGDGARGMPATSRRRPSGSASRRAPARLPDTLDGLLALPGVGPYTARAVLIFAHNADLAAVDANIRRVLLHELALSPSTSPGELQRLAERVLPRGRARDWHNALMDCGALVLTTRATGIAPLTSQGPFQGSRRWYRSRLVKLLLDGGPRSLDDVPALLGLEPSDALDVILALERDGVARRDGASLVLG